VKRSGSSATKPKIIPQAKARSSQLLLRVSLTSRSLKQVVSLLFLDQSSSYRQHKIIDVTNADATVGFDLISKAKPKTLLPTQHKQWLHKHYSMVHAQICTSAQLMLLYALQIGKLLRCASHLLTFFYRFTFFKISITVNNIKIAASK
jgi:hypothetical protein